RAGAPGRRPGSVRRPITAGAGQPVEADGTGEPPRSPARPVAPRRPRAATPSTGAAAARSAEPAASCMPVGVDWAEVYRETYRGLVRFLHRKVWDAERAHDLAQEVFVRALGQQPENPRAWLFTVAA